MHHAVHVSRSSPYAILGKQDTLSLNLLSKRIFDDIHGSDGSVYADEASFRAPPLSFICVLILLFCTHVRLALLETYTTRPRTAQTSDFSHIQLTYHSDGMTHWATNTVASECIMRCMFSEAPLILAWANRIR